uniref:Uncharacterized protein n=1 Tax=Rhizophagus irregularis (strain DAOM 181602 / DAOM 197198 / MUCL 43194) TaxID=747089 RepID=U9SN78_RHIID
MITFLKCINYVTISKNCLQDIKRCQGCHNNYETPETIHFLITNGKCNYIRISGRKKNQRSTDDQNYINISVHRNVYMIQRLLNQAQFYSEVRKKNFNRNTKKSISNTKSQPKIVGGTFG